MAAVVAEPLSLSHPLYFDGHPCCVGAAPHSDVAAAHNGDTAAGAAVGGDDAAAVAAAHDDDDVDNYDGPLVVVVVEALYERPPVAVDK